MRREEDSVLLHIHGSNTKQQKMLVSGQYRAERNLLIAGFVSLPPTVHVVITDVTPGTADVSLLSDMSTESWADGQVCMEPMTSAKRLGQTSGHWFESCPVHPFTAAEVPFSKTRTLSCWIQILGGGQ
ncbi:uncharacterized protein V6R79_002241 [Siganus canaliculatus]